MVTPVFFLKKKIWHFQSSAHHGVEFDCKHALQRFGNGGYEPCGVQTAGCLHSWFCQETHAWSGHFKNSHRYRHNISHSFRYKSNGWACLLLRLNFALLVWVSFNVRQKNSMVAGPSLLHCLVGSFLRHMIPSVSDGKLCERANLWGQQFWQDIQGLKEVHQAECFYFCWRTASWTS